MPDVSKPPSDTGVARLQNAIRRLSGCESGYLETVTVSESFHGFKTNRMWQGEVLVFEIRGHPHAKRARQNTHSKSFHTAIYVRSF